MGLLDNKLVLVGCGLACILYLAYWFWLLRKRFGTRIALFKSVPLAAFVAVAEVWILFYLFGIKVHWGFLWGAFIAMIIGAKLFQWWQRRRLAVIMSVAPGPGPSHGMPIGAMKRGIVEPGVVLDEEHEANEKAAGNVLSSNAMVPEYWTNRVREDNTSFDQMVYVSSFAYPHFDEMLKGSYKPIATQDRLCPKSSDQCAKTPGGCPCVKPGGNPGLPTGFVVRRIIRVEDSAMWQRYISRRDEIKERRAGDASLKPVEPPVVTDLIAGAHEDVFEPLDSAPELSEVYLWHGTAVRTALAIAQNDFNIDLAGGNAGTMYGRGAYLAESCTKADEYSKDETGGYYDGIYALLLVRACLGKYYYTQTRDQEASGKVASGDFDSTLGDRAASVNTYREFVVYNSDQIYPEYIVLYSRLHAADDELAVREAARTPFHMELPVYWTNCHCDPHADKFEVQYRVRRQTCETLQRLVSGSIRNADFKLRVIEARRVEDSEMWTRYVEFKRSVSARQLGSVLTSVGETENFMKDSISDTKSVEEFKVVVSTSELKQKVARLHFECEWKDQDWGNKKGVMKVCLMHSGSQAAEKDLFGVCRADGRTDWKKVERVLQGEEKLAKQISRGDTLVVKYKVGGGGGHQLHIKNFKLTVYYSDPESGPAQVARCLPPNELDGNHESGHTLTTALMQDLHAEDAISLENLDASVNEMLLWHGTCQESAEMISRGGFFIPRGERARHGKRFGEGAYFAEDLAKSMSYASSDSEGLFYVLLCRTSCGEIYYTEERVETTAHTTARTLGRDSILANPEKEGPREYIVLDESQVYPEFILHLRKE